MVGRLSKVRLENWFDLFVQLKELVGAKLLYLTEVNEYFL